MVGDHSRIDAHDVLGNSGQQRTAGPKLRPLRQSPHYHRPAAIQYASWIGIWILFSIFPLKSTKELRKSTNNGRIIITGTGRSGTTLLVQYFTALNFFTGFSLDEAVSNVDAISKAGLEKQLGSGNVPYVVKSPWIVDELEHVLKKKRGRVKAAIIPVRNLFEAAESRREVYRTVLTEGGDVQNHPGTIWKTEKPENQETALAFVLYRLIRVLAVHGITTYFLPFPEFADSHDVLFERLRPLLQQHRVSRSESQAAFQRVVDPKLIHRFDATNAKV